MGGCEYPRFDSLCPLLTRLKGHIGSNEDGITFLEEESIITDIAHIAGRSKVLSIRGSVLLGCEMVFSLMMHQDMLLRTWPHRMLPTWGRAARDMPVGRFIHTDRRADGLLPA